MTCKGRERFDEGRLPTEDLPTLRPLPGYLRGSDVSSSESPPPTVRDQPLVFVKPYVRSEVSTVRRSGSTTAHYVTVLLKANFDPLTPGGHFGWSGDGLGRPCRKGYPVSANWMEEGKLFCLSTLGVRFIAESNGNLLVTKVFPTLPKYKTSRP